MKAVVTGGAGFIASHLCERLLGEGHDVIVVDNLATGRRDNLSFAEHSQRLCLHELDVTNGRDIEPLLNGVDWVFHLAGLADIVPSIEQPAEYFQANVAGTLSMLELSRKAGARRFIYAASSSCYGVPAVLPTPETSPIAPEYPYALTKHQGEQLVLHWAKVYGLPTLSLRLFNVFGPRSRTTGAYGAVFGVFLAQKLACKPLTVVGDGTQTRDFTFVTDVAEAFLRAAESSVVGKALNVGTGKPQSVNHLVELLGGERTFIPRRPGEPDCTCADTSLIERLLGWRSTTSFEEGVSTLLSHLGDYRGAPVWDERSIHQATAAWFRYLSPGSASESTG
jgi:UDP-glucose 4-epimerase